MAELILVEHLFLPGNLSDQLPRLISRVRILPIPCPLGRTQQIALLSRKMVLGIMRSLLFFSTVKWCCQPGVQLYEEEVITVESFQSKE